MRNKNVKVIFWISVTINISIVLFFVGKRLYYADRNLYKSPEVFKEKYKAFLESPKDTNEVLFLGTSITEHFPVDQGFKDRGLKNLGVAASTSDSILNNVKTIVPRLPGKLFVECGINDFVKHLSINHLAGNINQMIQIVKSRSPRTELYFYAIFPTVDTTMNEGITTYNRKLEQLCKANEVTYININDQFLKGHTLDTSLTRDGFHLNNIGYFLWRRRIERLALN